MARQGKIARLPASLRTEVNQRLLDGQGAPVILPWLNRIPDAIRIWEELFEGAPCSPQNLSEWKLGGFKEWRAQRDRIENLKELSNYAIDLVKAANGTLSDAAAAIAAGHIVESMESIGNIVATGGSEDADADPAAGLAQLVGGIAKLQQGDRAREASRRNDARLKLDREKHQLSRQQLTLARQKFERQTVEKFLAYAQNPEVQAILGSGESRAAQMDQIHMILFGHSTEGGADE